MTVPFIDIDHAMVDRGLLGSALGELSTWKNWRVILRAAFGLPLLGADAREFFAKVAGDRKPPNRRVRRLWAVVARRAGKSRMAALIAVYLACFGRHKLAAGETGFVLVLAASKQQARTVFSYAKGFIESSPILRQQLLECTADEIRLKGNIVIGVHTNNFRTIRGRTLLACIFDEVAFWRDETSSQPDVETYRAVLPALATTDGMLVAISSPHAMRGLLFDQYNQNFGKDSDEALVIRAESRLMNPTLDRSIIDAALRDDPEAGRAEWLAEFRGDLALYISREALERCVSIGVSERPPDDKFRYFGFCDPSGGSSDSMTLGISHKDNDRAVLDALREVKAPFEPQSVVASFSELLRRYRINTVKGDRYGGEWVSSAFSAQGIRYMPSERSKSEIYRDCLPLFMNAEALLLDDPRLINQIANLERRTSRTGDMIDHARGAQDDLANAVAGALVHECSANWTGSTRDLPTRANTSGGRHPKPGGARVKPQRQDGAGPGGLYS